MTNIELISAAKTILQKNFNGTFTKPAPSLYPHQWNWDAGFIAIGLAHYDWERAANELRHLFKGQWKNGMLPHIVFGEEKDAQYFPGADFWWTEKSANAPQNIQTSGITQPPVFGFVLHRMYTIAKDKARAKAFLAEMYPKVVQLHQYLYENRDPNDEGLIYVQHPWEPGTDNSPTWDKALAKIDTSILDLPKYERKDLQNPKAAAHRPNQEDYDRYVHLVDIFRQNEYNDKAIFEQSPFLVQEPLFNAILAWSNDCLIEIGSILGEDVQQIMDWNALTIHSMNEKLWQEDYGMYDAYDLRNETLLPCCTNSAFMPLIGHIPTQEQAEKMHYVLESQDFSGTKDLPVYLCSTYDLTAENINFEKYWRGPIWINMNWMLCQGLKHYGFDKLAEKVRQDSLDLIRKNGFYEYFDPRKSQDGKAGYGTHQFSWSAALVIDFLSENEEI